MARPNCSRCCKAGEELAKQANYDIHTFFQKLRNNKKKERCKMVNQITNRCSGRRKRRR